MVCPGPKPQNMWMGIYSGKGVFAGVIKGRILRGEHPGFSEDTTADYQSLETEEETELWGRIQWTRPHVCRLNGPPEPPEAEDPLRDSGGAAQPTPWPLTPNPQKWEKISCNCKTNRKFWKRWEYQTTWPTSWETCMQVRKQQNWTWNNRLVPSRKRSTSRPYTVTLLI